MLAAFFFFNINLFYYFYYYYFLFYNIVLVLPYIIMHPPRVYACSPSWSYHFKKLLFIFEFNLLIFLQIILLEDCFKKPLIDEIAKIFYIISKRFIVQDSDKFEFVCGMYVCVW